MKITKGPSITAEGRLYKPDLDRETRNWSSWSTFKSEDGIYLEAARNEKIAKYTPLL